MAEKEPIVTKVLLAPILVCIVPFFMALDLVTFDGEALVYHAQVTAITSKPYWFVPYHVIRGVGYGLYYCGRGVVSYTTAAAITPDYSAYRAATDRAWTEASARQAAAQADFARWTPESDADRQRRVDERLAEARAQSAAEARGGSLRRIMGDLRQDASSVDVPPPRPLSGGLDPAGDDAVMQVRDGDLLRNPREDRLFAAAELGADALGLPGVVVAAKGAAAVVDAERELVVLESSRMEVRAKRLQQLQDQLRATKDLPAAEQPQAIRSALAAAAPLLARARADTDMSGWRLIANANARRENWEVEVPVLSQRIQDYARDHLRGAAADAVSGGIPLLRDLPDMPDLERIASGRASGRRFFAASVKSAGDDAVKRGVDWLDDVAQDGK